MNETIDALKKSIAALDQTISEVNSLFFLEANRAIRLAPIYERQNQLFLLLAKFESEQLKKLT